MDTDLYASLQGDDGNCENIKFWCNICINNDCEISPQGVNTTLSLCKEVEKIANKYDELEKKYEEYVKNNNSLKETIQHMTEKIITIQKENEELKKTQSAEDNSENNKLKKKIKHLEETLVEIIDEKEKHEKSEDKLRETNSNKGRQCSPETEASLHR